MPKESNQRKGTTKTDLLTRLLSRSRTVPKVRAFRGRPPHWGYSKKRPVSE
jgi:hypothetical protein